MLNGLSVTARRWRWLIVAACLLAGLAPGLQVRAQPSINSNMYPPNWYFGFELFRMLLEQSGAEPVSDYEDVFADPQNSVLVLVGQPPADRGFWRQLLNFVGRGGHVLVASDRAVVAPGLFRFSPAPVTTDRPVFQYQNHADCLRVVELRDSHRLLNSVNEIVVNRSGWLSDLTGGPGWQILARLPGFLTPQSASGMPLLAAYESPSSAGGQMVLLTDHSLLTNGMLWHADNAMLAVNLSQLLCSGNRQRLLFVADGSSLGSYREQLPVPEPSPELPDELPPITPPDIQPELELESMLRLANSVVTKTEDSNLLNSALIQRPRNIREPWFRRSLWIAAALAAGVLILLWLTVSGPRPAAAMPPRWLPGISDLSLNRHDSPRARGAAAQCLVRDLLQQLTGSTDPTHWQQQLSVADLVPPTATASGLTVADATTAAAAVPAAADEHSARSLKKSLRSARKLAPTLWSLAFNPRTPHLSRTRLVQLGQAVETIRRLHR